MGRHVSLLTVFVPCFKDVILLFWITLQEVKMRVNIKCSKQHICICELFHNHVLWTNKHLISSFSFGHSIIDIFLT